MSLFGGYYPILVYLLPFVALVAPWTVLCGFLLAIPQVLPFLGYFRKSVRHKAKNSRYLGKIPWKKLIEFALPIQGYVPVNGVHYPEMAMYMGFLPFCFIWFSHSRFWFVLIIGLLFVVGILPAIQRIPARTLFAVTVSVAILSTDGLSRLSFSSTYLGVILFLQAYLLFHNRNIYPSFPFSQWWDKPSLLYAKSRKANGWPFATGYLEGRRISEYRGAFRIRE